MNQSPQPEKPDLYDSTRFWTASRDFGFGDLFLTLGWLVAVVGGGAILFLFLQGSLPEAGVKALGVSYLSLSAALFGIVLAGLAIVAAFFDPGYVAKLREAGSLSKALFAFWWVAALAVLAILLSVSVTVASFAKASEPVTAAVLTTATVLFVASLCEALSLVGTIMRHALYRDELARHQPVPEDKADRQEPVA